MRGFELAHPGSLSEAIGILATDDPSVRPFSGGTALMLMIKSGVFQPSLLVSLEGIEPEYSEISGSDDGGLTIGAMATLATVARSTTVQRFAPVVPRAMQRLANARVRNVARMGGNLAHGDPNMDLPPILSSLRGEVLVRGAEGERSILIEELFSGYYETVLGPGELITHVTLPPQTGWSSAYKKFTTRSADDWPALGVAASVKLVKGAVADSRIMVSAATEKLTRLAAAEAALQGFVPGKGHLDAVADAAAGEAETIDDARGSAEYKTEILRVFIKRALTEAFAGEVIR